MAQHQKDLNKGRCLLPANKGREEAPDKRSKDCAASGLQEAPRHEAEGPNHLGPDLEVEVALHFACKQGAAVSGSKLL